MNRNRLTVATIGFGVALLAVAVGSPAAATPHHSHSSLVLSAQPAHVTVAPLPCDRRGEIDVALTNTQDVGVFVDATLSAPPQLALSRSVFSTYLPATDPDQAVVAPLTVTAKRGTDPGDYQVRLTAEHQRLDIPVTVEPAPPNGPTDNLALYQQAFASSVHPNETLCGGVDGNTDSAQWGASGTHDRTSGEFPDRYGVQLAAPATISRVELYTLDSAKYPASVMGIRDFDIEARIDGEFQVVRSVRGNTKGHLSLTFDPVTADQVQVVTYDSNDHKFSRIIELEVFDH